MDERFPAYGPVARTSINMPDTPISPLGAPPASDSEFKVYSSRPAVRFLSRGVQPPSQVYIDTSDVLQVGCATSQTNEVVTISYRVLRADGQLIKGQFQIFPLNNRAVVIKQEPLPEGFLLSVSCKAAVAITRGQTFVRIFLTDPVLGAGFPSYMLMADYVTTAMAPAHPNGRVLAPSEGPGNVTSFIGTGPPLGTDWIVVIPLNTRWKVKQTTARFVTSAAPGNRLVGLQANTGVFGTFHGGLTVPIPASSSPFIFSYPTSAYTPINPLDLVIPQTPDLVLGVNNTIGSITSGLQAGDQWMSIGIEIEEWLDNV